MKLTVFLGQFDVQWGNQEANYARIAALTEEASENGGDLILFPELCSTGNDLENWDLYASPLEWGLFPRLAELARRHRMALGGSLLEAYDGRACNTFVLYGNRGESLGAYRKVHLSASDHEDRWLAPGEELAAARTPWGPVGLTVCHDLRFPEIFRAYALQDARLILLVGGWPEQDIGVWRTLLRARAIENQIYVAAVNRVGADPDRAYGGRSAVIDPDGATLVEARNEPTLVRIRVDLNKVGKARKRRSTLRDRRPDLYGP